MTHHQHDNHHEFIDKCTARWLFEKTGVELYDEALKKCPDALRARFKKIRDEEFAHKEMLAKVIEKYGANPFTLTPSAKLTQTQSEGLIRAIAHSDFTGVIDSLLAAEMVDTANWEILVMMADRLGDRETKRLFEKALRDEIEHLRFIREHVLKLVLPSKPGRRAA